jgi:hypothetical protein
LWDSIRFVLKVLSGLFLFGGDNVGVIEKYTSLKEALTGSKGKEKDIDEALWNPSENGRDIADELIDDFRYNLDKEEQKFVREEARKEKRKEKRRRVKKLVKKKKKERQKREGYFQLVSPGPSEFRKRGDSEGNSVRSTEKSLDSLGSDLVLGSSDSENFDSRGLF